MHRLASSIIHCGGGRASTAAVLTTNPTRPPVHHHTNPPPPLFAAATPRRPLLLPARAKPWRPDHDDVERLSTGGAAKRRGTGSYHVAHRLNADEARRFAAAKKTGYLSIRGSGGRRGSKRGGGKGSGRPLLNTWRQWCDAKGWAVVLVEQQAGVVAVASAGATGTGAAGTTEAAEEGPSSSAVVIVDFSTLRRLDARPFAARARQVAALAGGAAAAAGDGSGDDDGSSSPSPSAGAGAAGGRARELGVFERGDGEVPFDVVGAGGEDLLASEAEADDAAIGAALVPGRIPLRGGAAGGEGEEATDEGDAAAAIAAAPTSSSAPPPPPLPEGHPYATSAIWSIPAQPLFFAVDEGSSAKALAAELVRALNGGGAGGGGGGGGGSSGGSSSSGAKKKAAARKRRVFDGDDM